MNTRSTGDAAEKLAEQYLWGQGFKTIQKNFRTRTGEIDLIMSDADLLVFVEVRMRNNPARGSGAESINAIKKRKIINTARWFIQRYGHSTWQRYRFDVVSVDDGINWIPGAFTLD